jgi:hypothetical protein
MAMVYLSTNGSSYSRWSRTLDKYGGIPSAWSTVLSASVNNDIWELFRFYNF